MFNYLVKKLFHATQYPLKKRLDSIIRTKTKQKINNICILLLSFDISSAKTKKLGKNTITYLGVEERLPWIVGNIKPIKA